MVLTYSAGAMTGPIVGSTGMSIMGPSGLFVVIGVLALIGALYGFWRMARSAPVPSAEQQAFQSLPRTTPMAAVLEVEDE